jgi:cytochrome P450
VVLAALGGLDWRAAAAAADAPDLRRTPILRACVDETMRLHPPVTRLPARVAVRDLVLPVGPARKCVKKITWWECHV